MIVNPLSLVVHLVLELSLAWWRARTARPAPHPNAIAWPPAPQHTGAAPRARITVYSLGSRR